MTRVSRTALFVWVVLTLLVAASLLLIYARLGAAGLSTYIQTPPLINLPITLASAALVWLSFGGLLWLLASRRVDRTNALALAGLFTVLWVYLNVLSERVRYGDYTYYFDAADALHKGQPLPGSYFYPPLWATLIQFLAPLGLDGFLLVLWILNVLALALFFILVLRVLQRYGFSPRVAALVTTLFILANAPLLRTLIYVQVNLHVLNLILLSLVLYPKRPFLSALALAAAVHLKATPAVLVLAFLLERDWRWLGWFALCMLGLAGFTLAVNGVSPFLIMFRNMQGLALSENTIFHDTSIDSFMRFTGHIFGLGIPVIRILVYALKVALLACTVLVMARCIRSVAFTRTVGRGQVMLNAIPPLFILMTLASPIVWEHHGIFVALPFLLLLKRLAQPSAWLLFAFAYLLQFLLPTFDFYPWSFGRLIAPLIALWLIWRTAPCTSSPSIDTLAMWLERAPV